MKDEFYGFEKRIQSFHDSDNKITTATILRLIKDTIVVVLLSL